MRLVTFGANGGSGRAFVRQALAAGHEVAAVTRRPGSFDMEHPRLRVLKGDATDASFVAEAIEGADAVVSTLGTPYTFGPVTLYSVSAAHIIAAMQQKRVRRLLVVSSTGVDPRAGSQGDFFYDHVLEPFLAHVVGRTAYTDMRTMEAQVSCSGLDWTIVRPSALFDQEAAGEYLVGERFVRGRFTARQDLAAFLLAQVAEPTWVGRVACVTSPGAHPSVFTIILQDAVLKK